MYICKKGSPERQFAKNATKIIQNGKSQLYLIFPSFLNNRPPAAAPP